MEVNKELNKALKKIATEISSIDICGDGGCPCKKGCEVMREDDCIIRIIDWMQSVINK